ncbi:MAG: tetratricopeptide repeat protein [Puniceicoccaceae bacterium]
MSRIPPILLLLAASLAAGVATLPLLRALEPPPRDLGELEGMGQTVLIGTLGGLRALAADFLWLRAYNYWQERNHGLTEATTRAVTRLQPDYPYFWIETARMIVFDMPVWRFGPDRSPPKSVERRIRREQAERGLDLLREAAGFLPDSPAIPAEMARIHWTVLDDPGTAQEYYREAYAKPDASPLHARLRAVILMDMGRDREALAWLEEVLADLEPETSPAQYALMVEYLEELRAGRNPREPEADGTALPRALPGMPDGNG